MLGFRQLALYRMGIIPPDLDAVEPCRTLLLPPVPEGRMRAVVLLTAGP